MGLFMRINAFRGVAHADVRTALADFWSQQNRRLEPLPLDGDADAFDLYEQHHNWTVLSWTAGWEWTLRRQAQLHVSKTLNCPGLLVFVYDGDDWGYELFARGTPVDWFVQWPQPGNTWFPGKDLAGRPDAIVDTFPDLRLVPQDVAPYLAQRPDDEQAADLWNTPARPHDRFRRGDDLAALDFLSLLGIHLNTTARRLSWPAPLHHRFQLNPPVPDGS